MSINLTKGGSLDLSKTDPTLVHVLVGLGWDVNKYDTGGKFDLDASAFCLNTSDKVNSERDMVCYLKTQDGTDFSTHPSGAIKYMGDNRTGDGDGDDEQIKVDLSMVPDNINKIAFTATIYEAAKNGQNFGQVSNAYIRIVNEDSGEEICRCDLTENFSFETAVVMGELYRYNGSWKFKAVEAGYNDGLAGLCRDFGIDANGG